MAQLTDLEKVRRRRARKRTVRNLFLLVVFAAIVVLGVSLIKYAGEIDLATAYSDIKAGIVTGEGYPVSLPGGQISRMETSEDVVYLLSDTHIYSYNATGSQLLNQQHNLSNPAMTIAGDRVMLYDRGGTRVLFCSKSSQIGTMDLTHNSLTADLATNGNYAVATGSNETLAKVAVYNKNGDNIFNWLSTKPVVSVSLSDSRESMLVGHVDVANGSYRSNISRFQFSISDGATASIDLEPGELLLWVDYRGGNTVRALTDQRLILLNGDLKELSSFSFGTERLDRVINRPNERVAVVLGSFTEEKHLRVVTLGDDFSKQSDFTIDYDLVEIKADADYIYLAAKDKIELRRADGTLMTTVPVNGVGKIEPMQGILYYTTASQIRTLDPKAASKPSSSTAGKGESKSPSASQSASENEKDAPPGEQEDSSVTDSASGGESVRSSAADAPSEEIQAESGGL